MKEYCSKHFPAGEYYIGDLCYVMHSEWKDLCDLMIINREVIDGGYSVNGKEIFIASTAYGDGEYQDEHGNEYGVDSGSLGIIAIKDISEEDKENIKLGHIFTFKEQFQVSACDGGFIFGDVRIDTNDPDEDEEWYDSNYDDWHDSMER